MWSMLDMSLHRQADSQKGFVSQGEKVVLGKHSRLEL